MERLKRKLKKYGKLEVFEINDQYVEIKITKGYIGLYEPTMRIGELMLKTFPKYYIVEYGESRMGLLHYIFSKK